MALLRRSSLVPRQLEYDARDFGIAGDPINLPTIDSAPALQTALNTVAAAGGGTLVLPPGYIRFNSTIIMPQYVRLKGAGRGVVDARGTTVFFRPSVSSWAFQIGDPATNTGLYNFEDLEVAVNHALALGGFDVRTQVRNCGWTRVRVVGNGASAGTGIQFSGSTVCNCYHVLRECNFTSLLVGVRVSGQANAGLMEHCTFGFCGTCLDFSKTGSDTTAGDDWLVLRCELTSGVGLNLADTANRLTFVKCVWDGAASSVVSDTSCADIVFVGCRFDPAPDANTLARYNFVSTSFGGSAEAHSRYKQLRYTPRAATPVDPASSGEIVTYQKGALFIIMYNDAGTVRFKYLDMTGTGVTWVHTTTPP